MSFSGLTFPIPGVTDPAGNTGPLTGTGNTTVGSAATSAQHAAEVSDKVMQEVMRNVVPFQGDMSQMVQNRPQVMLPQPVRPKPATMGQPHQIQATTASGQRRNDISSLISSVGNIVKGAVNKKREAEDRDLMADLAVIQAASSNPQDPHNQAILDAIAKDPKRVKRLEKAIGYNPLAGEPPPPETQTMMKFGAQSQQKDQQKHAALTQAIAEKLGPQAAQQGGGGQPTAMPGQGGGAMDALLSRSPNVAQLNPIVQLQAGLIKAGVLPKADTSLNAMTSLFKDIMTNDAKYAEIQGRLKEKNLDLSNKLAEIRERGKALMEQEKMRQTGATERTKIRAGATVKSAKIRAEASKETARIRQENIGKRDNAKKQHAMLKNAAALIQKDISNLDVQIAAASDKTGGYFGMGGNKGPSPKAKLIAEQQAKKASLNNLEQMMLQYDKEIGQLNKSLKQSPTSELDTTIPAEDVSPAKMDEEDRIF